MARSSSRLTGALPRSETSKPRFCWRHDRSRSDPNSDKAHARRAQVADVLNGIDAVDASEIDAVWASVCADRYDEIKRGTAKTFARDQAEEYLDARGAGRGA